jgi:hypothetical protein
LVISASKFARERWWTNQAWVEKHNR